MIGADHAHVAVLARAIGENALAGFFVALVVLLLAVAGITRAGQGYALRAAQSAKSAQSSLLPAAFLIRSLIAGFALLVGAAAVFALIFALIASEIGVGEDLPIFDQALSDAIHDSVAPGVLRIFGMLTHLGDTATLTALCVAVAVFLLVRQKRWLALGWVLAIVGNSLLNTTLKRVFERIRPVHDQTLAVAQGWSFPSGHTSGSVVAYGMLAYVVARTTPPKWHLPAILVAAAVAFSVGCSRVFIQVHFASDVAAGFVSGSAWLAVCIASIELTRFYRRRR